jgi:hypothetical protein
MELGDRGRCRRFTRCARNHLPAFFNGGAACIIAGAPPAQRARVLSLMTISAGRRISRDGALLAPGEWFDAVMTSLRPHARRSLGIRGRTTAELLLSHGGLG